MTAPTPLRWGILGTGAIAASFVTDLGLLDDHVVAAVGSRSDDGARRFGDAHGVARRHGSYAALVADPEVDVVYVATPHPFHHPCALLAIAAGKHVLVEKPFTMDGAEAREVFAAARARGVLVVEAMWTRFLPWVLDLTGLLADGALGELRSFRAELGTRFPHDESSRLLDPALGGGALLDLGVYPVSLACLLLGPPESVTAVSTPATTGVDAQTSVLMTHAGGTHSLVSCSLLAEQPNTASLVGTTGHVEVDAPFFTPGGFTLTTDGGTERHEHPDAGIGLRHQAVEVARCVRAGLTESPLHTAADTLVVMDALGAVRDFCTQGTRNPAQLRSPLT